MHISIRDRQNTLVLAIFGNIDLSITDIFYISISKIRFKQNTYNIYLWPKFGSICTKPCPDYEL